MRVETNVETLRPDPRVRLRGRLEEADSRRDDLRLYRATSRNRKSVDRPLNRVQRLRI